MRKNLKKRLAVVLTAALAFSTPVAVNPTVAGAETISEDTVFDNGGVLVDGTVKWNSRGAGAIAIKDDATTVVVFENEPFLKNESTDNWVNFVLETDVIGGFKGVSMRADAYGWSYDADVSGLKDVKVTPNNGGAKGPLGVFETTNNAFGVISGTWEEFHEACQGELTLRASKTDDTHVEFKVLMKDNFTETYTLEYEGGVPEDFVFYVGSDGGKVTLKSVTFEAKENPGPSDEPTAEPTEGTETAEPTEGTETAEPTEGTETAEPTEGTETAEPTESTETAAPTQGTETAAPTQGTETTEPTQGTETTEPTQGTETTAPTQGTETAAPTQGTETTAPTQGTETAEPTQGTEPTAEPTQGTETEAPTAAPTGSAAPTATPASDRVSVDTLYEEGLVVDGTKAWNSTGGGLIAIRDGLTTVVTFENEPFLKDGDTSNWVNFVIETNKTTYKGVSMRADAYGWSYDAGVSGLKDVKVTPNNGGAKGPLGAFNTTNNAFGVISGTWDEFHEACQGELTLQVSKIDDTHVEFKILMKDGFTETYTLEYEGGVPADLGFYVGSDGGKVIQKSILFKNAADITTPTPGPSADPSAEPSADPSADPSANPSADPSANPSADPSAEPSADPSAEPSADPSAEPSADPSAEPSADPSAEPSADPSAEPSADPSASPSTEPTQKPDGGEQTTASLTLDKASATLYTGKVSNSVTVKPTVKGASQTVTWTTSNAKVATVDSKGVITAVAAGTATITAKANGITKTVSVTVKNPTITVKKGKKAAKKVTVKRKKSVTLKVSVTPSGSGMSLAKLDKKAKKIVKATLKGGKLKIKGKKKGSVTLKIKSGKATKKVKVKVK